MTSKSEDKKILRKQKRCQMMLTKDTGINCVEESTTILAICNAGLTTGLNQEDLIDEANKYASIKDVLMLPGKSYCFIKLFTTNDAILVYNGMHGKSKLGQNNCVLYLSYCDNVPVINNPWNFEDCPKGLILLENIITEEEEINLLKHLQWDEEGGALKNRQVKHFGYEFIYGKNNCDVNKPLEQKIPNECNLIWKRLAEKFKNFSNFQPDQLTVNKYEPGQGIPQHVDTHSAFCDPIVSLSLCGDIVMEFKNSENIVRNIYLPKRSLLIMSEESRYGWTHGITPRFIDVIPNKQLNLLNNGLVTKKRSLRISFTFRKLNFTPCSCIYPKLCDTQMSITKSKNILEMNPAKLEMENVHNVYNEIANHFSETRHKPWPKVEEFLNKFTCGDILIDVGCGNGKYLTINQNLFKIGCDRSDGLLKVCRERGFNVFQCDCLNLPLKSDIADGVISIAVIHHLASDERRLQAIKEMTRILCKNGKGLIYVWSKNQEINLKKSNYLKKNINNVDNSNTEDDVNVTELPIHENRTDFKAKDVLVPWKLKNANKYLRYYHVFDENELVNLLKQINNIIILDNYYDQGNWCVIFQKI